MPRRSRWNYPARPIRQEVRWRLQSDYSYGAPPRRFYGESPRAVKSARRIRLSRDDQRYSSSPPYRGEHQSALIVSNLGTEWSATMMHHDFAQNASLDPVSRPVPEFFEKLRSGDLSALNQLTPVLYDELHRIASRHLRGERPN